MRTASSRNIARKSNYFLLLEDLKRLAAITIASSRATYLMPINVIMAEMTGNTVLMVKIISGSLLKNKTAR